ncbi:hypothetical protein C3747_89g59 [Trypanosoma cruzi]|uniref:Uncharacterized protein n=2 Tax=Trypanosoma cruzi TaxID=5693 RepID=Q4CU42_TRYCC|nr:hypothetical protein, conserved [Trypanosoma cruzi]EAN83794.1 hypothetical protein, conserved [Trypanosoma cruzi]PWV08551.1 hypothetical protein C3747_89g59 [Trypanosoma cruzi]RNC49493.1 hypothetical protein TcCL_NonESM00723 [Trypanosoma cruzi]|eukprot:XP_805645.1 hypothetical protein [Trypanosoma cruzi strain CL Brener]
MKEEPMSSNKRIQLLRERLELYNATIAEAMGVVTGVAGTETTAAPGTNTNNNDAKNSGHASEWQRTEREGGRSAAAPCLERNLSAEFNAARATGRAAAASGADNSNRSEGGGGARRIDRRTVPPPPTPPNESRRGDLRSCSTSSASHDDSTSTYSFESGEEAFLNPFLNETISVEEISASVRKVRRTEMDSTARAATSVLVGGRQKSTSPHESNRDMSTVDEGDNNERSSLPLPPSPPEEAKEEARNRKDTTTAEAASWFAGLEMANNKLAVTEQAIFKLQRTVDIEHFKRSLPQRQQALQLAESRDDLVKKEQALRRREPTGNSLAMIYEADALDLDQQLQQLLAECNAAKALFTRVHERKAAVAEKERLLKRKLGELEDLQREVREKRQALTTLERRNEQREAMLAVRGEAYRKDLEAHKAREQSLQERISGVEELSQKVASWMKILDERDTKIEAKEQRLRRVQSDLVRRSEELLCYRNGRAKPPSRMASRQTNSP